MARRTEVTAVILKRPDRRPGAKLEIRNSNEESIPNDEIRNEFTVCIGLSFRHSNFEFRISCRVYLQNTASATAATQPDKMIQPMGFHFILEPPIWPRDMRASPGIGKNLWWV